MRTPGRCSNLEGCWISASHRDVWLSVGEDFNCPNCGGALVPPPGRSMSMRGLKRAAITGVAATMGIAAVAVATVKLSAISWSGQHAVVAMAHAPSSLPGSTLHRQTGQTQIAAAMPATNAMPVAPPRQTPIAPTRLARNAPAKAPQAVQTRAPAPVLVYAAPNEPAPVGRKAAQPAEASRDQAEQEMPAPLITLISQAAFVLPPSSQRPLVLPISFGQPPGPETDAAPVSKRWRHHGVINLRHTGFLPAPGPDSISAICRTPSMLH